VNRSQGKVQEMVERGAKAGTTPSAASADAEVVCLCLTGEETVETVLTGADGVLAGARPGTIVVDHSTIHPEAARKMGAACAAKGVAYLDAPVSGTGKVAWDARLTIMCGGEQAAFDRVQPVLEPVSANRYLVGPVGSGNITKLINNMIGDINQIAIMEAFVLAAKLGIEQDALLDVLRTASANSRQLERIGPKIVARDFTPTSSLGGHVHGQALMGWLCEQAGIRLPLREVAEAFWKRGVEAGLGPGDPVKGITLLEADAGLEVKEGYGS
jgi:3-hydroxyisobutyrate dehydrogenase-like beta-hydroxyacid dehydrogenase